MTEPKQARHRALIIGGSISGLFAAALLDRIGWRVEVYERSADELASRGAGIATHPELMKALERAGVDLAGGIGVEIEGRVTFGLDGAVIGRHDMRQIMTSWDLLYRRLFARMPAGAYHGGVPLERIEQRDGRIRAHFAGGESSEGDLLIGADGVRSTVRSLFLPEVRPHYAGYVAWRGMVPEPVVSEATRRVLDKRLSFCLPPGEQFLHYPIANEDGVTTPGERRMNWVWYRHARPGEELELLLTDRDGRRHDVSMPPGRIDPACVAAMRADAERDLPPQYQELVRLTERPFLQAIFDVDSPQIRFGRAVLVGDAAFVARPHTGFGVTKAAEDVVALADALSGAEDVDRALDRWHEARLAAGHAAVVRGRVLGRMLDADRSSPSGDSFGLERGVPRAVMAETGVSEDMED
jgi:2-polyprenyl-6-methoxyphenol hydroxylase-like FAD-dependent oxidoreductase